MSLKINIAFYVLLLIGQPLVMIEALFSGLNPIDEAYSFHAVMYWAKELR